MLHSQVRPPLSHAVVWSRSQRAAGRPQPGGGAGGVAGADQVNQGAGGVVADLGVGVVAGTPGDRGQWGGQDAGRPDARGCRAGRRVAKPEGSSAGWRVVAGGSGARWSGARWSGAG